VIAAGCAAAAVFAACGCRPAAPGPAAGAAPRGTIGVSLLALAGLVGAGRTETLRLIFGADRKDAGTILLAKWLERDCEVLFFDEPTRGIDVGARHEFYLLMNDLVARGKAIVMVSSDLSEVLGLADRILVMHDGRITGELDNRCGATQEDVMRLAMA